MKKRIFSVVLMVVCISLVAAVSYAGMSAGDTMMMETAKVRDRLVPGKYATIQKAIEAANTGDTVIVSDGTYKEKIDFKGKAITVKSVNGAKSTIIDGAGAGPVVIFYSNEMADSVLQGFTVTNGSNARGGGIFFDRSSPTIDNCIIKGNSSSETGGGVYSVKASPIIKNSTITGNSSSGDGGGVYGISSSVALENSTVANNTATGKGGGVYFKSKAGKITKSTIEGNKANYAGGGLYCEGTTMALEGSTFKDNKPNDQKGCTKEAKKEPFFK